MASSALTSEDEFQSFSWMSKIVEKLEQVSVFTKANVYFDGKVVSHSVEFVDGSKKTLGLIYPGSYHFGTEKAEWMEMVAGTVKVTLDGSESTSTYEAGSTFEVPANSGFTIEVTSGIAEYICTFIEE